MELPVQDAQPAPAQRLEPPEQSTPPGQDAGDTSSGQPAGESGQADQTDQGAPGFTTESAPGVPVTPPRGSPSAGLTAVGILIGVCLVGGVLVMMVRRRLLQDETDDASVGSLMDSLRGMLRRGEITQEEFDATKRSMAMRLSAKFKAGPPRAQGQPGEGTG